MSQIVLVKLSMINTPATIQGEIQIPDSSRFLHEYSVAIEMRAVWLVELTIMLIFTSISVCSPKLSDLPPRYRDALGGNCRQRAYILNRSVCRLRRSLLLRPMQRVRGRRTPLILSWAFSQPIRILIPRSRCLLRPAITPGLFLRNRGHR